ncbi:class I adenylate-forming enzyme family protein [Streptomyces sp. NPDC021020]|uniref:class I adenylate-forming enzyme family protein n=1 Tax=Streptomyces sp. NPDC021020 TaxID=3365109 RepID=UPI00379F9930
MVAGPDGAVPPTIHGELAAAARRYGDAAGVVQIAPSGAVVSRIGLRQLDRAAADRAERLSREIPAASRRVAVSVTNSIASVVDLLAVLRYGASAVVVDDADSAERKDEQTALLCDAVLTRDPHGSQVRLPAAARPLPGTEESGLVVFTTGSTAASKPVAQSHRAVLANVHATIRHHGMRPGETMACALPLSHVNGLHFGLLATLLSGGVCVLFERFDPLSYLRVLARTRANRATTVPSLLHALADMPRWPDLDDLRYFVTAAAPLPVATARAVHARGGHRLVQGYGLSECMNFATTMPVDLAGAAYEEHVLRRPIPAVGHQLGSCEVAVLAADGTRLPAGEVGEVAVRGDSLMSGYIGDPAATDEAVGSGWLRTGDLGRLEERPSSHPWLTLVGRQKNVAKCGGLSVSLEELDRWLDRLDGVREACCVRVPDARRGDAVTACYVPQPAGAEPEDVRRHIARRFDPGAIGLTVLRLERLPRLRSGKIDRRALGQR